jgi:hypothetical protein
MAKLTITEQDALMQAMKSSYGDCNCREVMGRIMHCDGHRFLGEVQMYAGSLTDRVSILVYYRRMARLFRDAEFSQPFVSVAPPVLEVTPLPESISREPADPNKLPW